MGPNQKVLPSRSLTFYWDFVIFKVQEKLYKVPKHIFEKSSEVFADMFSLPQCDPVDATVQEGLSDEHPITLPLVESAHFEALLSALLVDTRYTNYSDVGLGREQWLWVLELANKWQMVNMRRLAITQLSNMKLTDVDRIVYGHRLAVADWLLTGYRDIASRTVVINAEDVELLGVNACLLIWQVQLKAWNQAGGYNFQPLLRRLLTDTFMSTVNDAYQRGINLGDLERNPRPGF